MKRVLLLLFVALEAATYEVTEEDICCLPEVTGSCKAALKRWYYNVEKDACEEFTYGGCDGNENNFLTKCHCQKRCGSCEDICCQAKEVGPCRAAMTRWYYNSTNKACETFIYGGCQGNQNNFEEKCHCEQICL